MHTFGYGHTLVEKNTQMPVFGICSIFLCAPLPAVALAGGTPGAARSPHSTLQAHHRVAEFQMRRHTVPLQPGNPDRLVETVRDLCQPHLKPRYYRYGTALPERFLIYGKNRIT